MSDPIRVAISGAGGRMGRVLARLIAEDPSLSMVGRLERPLGDAASVVRDADVVVDFSAPECLRGIVSLPRGSWAETALVVGTTGLGAEDERALDELSRSVPVVQAANFSIGVNLLLSLAEQAGRVLGGGYDAEIVEAHHRRKEDAPSGTALELGRAVARGRDTELDAVRLDGRSGRPGARTAGEIGFHAVRGGEVVGEHRVLFLGDRERVELGHVATDRALFAEGALRAARWAIGRPPGRYGMREVLGFSGG